jgi:hypothetical protein
VWACRNYSETHQHMPGDRMYKKPLQRIQDFTAVRDAGGGGGGRLRTVKGGFFDTVPDGKVCQVLLPTCPHGSKSTILPHPQPLPVSYRHLVIELDPPIRLAPSPPSSPPLLSPLPPLTCVLCPASQPPCASSPLGHGLKHNNRRSSQGEGAEGSQSPGSLPQRGSQQETVDRAVLRAMYVVR